MGERKELKEIFNLKKKGTTQDLDINSNETKDVEFDANFSLLST